MTLPVLIKCQVYSSFSHFYTAKGKDLSTLSRLLKSINIFIVNYSKQGIVEIKTSSQDQALEIVRRRIDEIGTNEPNILKRGNDRILVELPGLDDPMRIKSLLGKTANLTFRFVTNNNEDSFGAEKLEYEDGSEESMVSKRIILSGDNLLDAQPRMDSENNETVVSFTLDRVGAKRFGKATSTGIGKQLAIVLDGKIISAPVVRDIIASGSGQISGGFTFQSATDLALLLRSGALPAPLNIIEERTVGPDLGQDSINAGMIALAIGFALVILFIFIKYKIFGLITNIALIINLFLLIGVLTIFEATLTLPGIAGIILTVGMAEQQIKPSILGVPFTATFEGAIRSSKRRKKTGSAEKHWTGFLIRRSGSWKYRAFNPRPTLRKQDDRADQQVSLFDGVFQHQN